MNEPLFHRYDVWRPTEKYTNHRIPGIIVTSKGTVLIYCEARRSLSDWALMDIILQRSQDNGETFSPPVELAKGSEEHNTVNNPVMLEDRNGRIHFLYCEDYSVCGGRILTRYSDDDGITWSAPIDISDFSMPFYHNVFAFGPGHGITAKDGTLIVPVWMVPKYYEAPVRSHFPSVLSTFYSKDNGETWAIGEILKTRSDVINPNETVAALTSDGNVYLNIRNAGFNRARAYSANGYSGWTQFMPDYNLPDPICFGSVASYNDGEKPYSIIFVNCDSKTERKNVTVRISTDDGHTYPVSRVIDKDRGGYSDIAVDNERKLIYVIYEDKGGTTDYLAVFNYEWVTEIM